MSTVLKRNLRVLEVELGVAAAYSAGDQVGAVTDLGRVATPGALMQLVELKVYNDDAVTPALEALLFKTAPADAGDNAAFVLSAADLDLLVLAGDVATGDYVTVAGKTVASSAHSSVGVLTPTATAGDGHLHLVLVATAGVTIPAALRVQIVLEEA